MPLPRPAPLVELVRYPIRRSALRARFIRPYWVRRFESFGVATILDRPEIVLGPHKITIGSHTLIQQGCHLCAETHGWHRSSPILCIGDRVAIRPHCMISASESVIIEDDVVIGAYSSVVDSDHTFREGRPNVLHNSVDAAPVHIGRGTWLAERVAVLRGAKIGRCCIIGANSVVKGSLPDYTIAVGAPARAVGRVTGVDADAAPASHTLF